MDNFIKVGNEITGLKPGTMGIVTNIDGSYFLVLPKGRKKRPRNRIV